MVIVRSAVRAQLTGTALYALPIHLAGREVNNSGRQHTLLGYPSACVNDRFLGGNTFAVVRIDQYELLFLVLVLNMDR